MKSKFKLTAIAMTLAAALTSPLAAQELTLKLGHLANEQNSWRDNVGTGACVMLWRWVWKGPARA